MSVVFWLCHLSDSKEIKLKKKKKNVTKKKSSDVIKIVACACLISLEMGLEVN